MYKKLSQNIPKLTYLLFTVYYLTLSAPASAVDIGDAFTLVPAGRTLGSYVGPVLRAAIIGAGVITFLLFLGGGFTIITSAGSSQKNEKGKSAITAGVAGLVLVVSAYWIVQLISEFTGIDLLNPGV